MWEKQAKKVYLEITPQEVWDIWCDVDGWPNWNTDLEFSKLNGAFKKGATINIKPKIIPPITLVLEEVIQNESFIDSMLFPGAKMLYRHAVKDIGVGVELLTTVSILGDSYEMWIPLIGEKVASTMEIQMDALIVLIRRLKHKTKVLQ